MSGQQLEPAAPEWRAADPDEIVWTTWDEEHIAFHRPSGKTHLVNAATAVLLKQILVDYKNASAAAAELAEAQEAVGSDAFFAEVASSIQRLEQLGLVHRRGG